METVFRSLTEENRTIWSKSGNPGYLEGKPVLVGVVDPSVNLKSKQVLQLFPNKPMPRTVFFGQDYLDSFNWMIHQVDNRTEWCSKWRRLVLEQFWGADITDWRMATYGNSELNHTEQWIPIHIEFKLVCFDPEINSEMVIVHAKSGTFEQPQSKIIGAAIRLESGGNDVCQTSSCSSILSQSVTFIDDSSSTSMILPGPPRWRLRLPRDFFYPFLLLSSSSLLHYSPFIILFTTSLFLFDISL